MILQFLNAILKTILFFLFLLILYVFFIGWTNIWIKPGSIGILYTYQAPATPSNDTNSANSAHTEEVESISLVSKQAWNWEWKRALPFRTKLIQLPLLHRSVDFPVRYFLPSARLYSSLVNKPEEIFLEEGTITLHYALDSKKLIPFLQEHSLSYPEDVSLTLQTQIYHIIQGEFLQYAEISQTDELKKAIRTALGTLPILITSVDYRGNSTADRKLYTLLQEVYTEDLQNQLNLTKSNRFTDYISVLEKLSDLSLQDSNLLEIIRLLPPNEVIQYLEN